MIAKVSPDKNRSSSLKEIAKITLERLNNTDTEKYPSNTLLDYYDVIHRLMEALAIKDGVKIKGEGAHQELIEYTTKKLELNEQTRRFLQQIRDYRNRISYEGLMINKNYINLNKKRIQDIIKILFEKLS